MHHKRQHYVPVMLQKNFCAQDGRMHCFDRRRASEGVFATDPSNLFVRGHLYSTIEPDGSRSTSLEEDFSRREGEAAPVLEKIISSCRTRKLPSLSPSEKRIAVHFFYDQWRRVPAIRERLANKDVVRNTIERFVSEIEQRAPHRKDVRLNLLSEASVTRMHQNIHVGSLQRASTTVLDILNARGLAFARVPKAKSFVLGSQPLVKLRGNNTSELNDESVEVWLPIAHDLAMSPGRYREPEVIVEVSSDWLRKLNEAIARQSEAIASHCKPLVESLCWYVGRPSS